MSKAKKKPQQQQQLSPTNYIRQKARNLPIHECWINADWKTHGEANIVVSRVHANGNYTYGVYLVDLYCLGIKDAFFNFNVDIDIYNKLLDRMEYEKKNKVPYELVHNIIYAAKEYADELGFKPHKEFTSVAQFILEEDTEDIELIDIECGYNGKPLYIDAGHESPAQVKQIINQLNQSVGKGNFIVKEDKWGYDEEDDFDDDEEDEASLEDLKQDFIRLSEKKLDNLTDDEKFELLDIMDSIFYKITDSNKIDNLLDKWSEETQIEFTGSFDNVKLGIDQSITLTKDDYDSISEVMELALVKSKKYGKAMEKLRKKWGELPFFAMLDLKIMSESVDSDINQKKLRQFIDEFPDYPFFKLQKYQLEMSKFGDDKIKVIMLDDIFKNKENISLYEFNHFLEVKAMTVIYNNNPVELEAMYTHLDDFDISQNDISNIKAYLVLARHRYLCQLFDVEYLIK